MTEWSEPTTWRLGRSEGGLGGCGRGMFRLLKLSAKAKDILYAMQTSSQFKACPMNTKCALALSSKVSMKMD